MHTIEIFPANKTCEQGCSTCPMARKNNSLTTETTINKDVQETFSLIEKKYKNKKIQYDLHFTSTLNLFPHITYPKLLNMTRFETSKEVRLGENSKLFSENIKKLLVEKNIDPKVIGFSIVPGSLVLSTADRAIVGKIIKEITNWYFLKENKSLEVTIRNNLIRSDIFKQKLPLVFQKDHKYLRKLIEKYSTFDTYEMDTYSKDELFYLHKYSGVDKTNKISISNRIIAEIKKATTVKELKHQAIWASPIKENASFAIAPQGVMIQHASVYINNPILWLNHSDFRKTIEEETSKPRFSFGNFSRNLIVQNAVMYEQIYREYGSNIKIKNSEISVIFEEWRKLLPKK